VKLFLSEHTLDVNLRRCDVTRFDFAEVEDYVRALTGDRTYQFNAIAALLTYLWGGIYTDVRDLASDHWDRKPAIRQRFFDNKAHFLAMLPLPDRLSGVCHMATGTGKSYVIFAVAYLSLILGKVSRVLVLGPSSTVIEAGLRAKFNDYLYGRQAARLQGCLPQRLRHRTIRLLTCNDPVCDNAIVIENINAIYNRERNAIGDTLFNHGGDVLVLSDEVHHAYSHLKFSGAGLGYDFDAGGEGSGEVRDERLWLRYLREEPGIKRHIGFTGTPYNKDDYFTDVIFNYSVKDARDDKRIKRINPILRTETDEGDGDLTRRQRFEQIIATHRENAQRFGYPDAKGRPRVKPITIFIHPTQTKAQENAAVFIQVLAQTLRQSEPGAGNLPTAMLEQRAGEQVITVVSRLAQTEYRQKLEQIEQTEPAKPGGKVQFIFAVNKLSEGWDVDNVFQIVPSEERIFNSKLLISQVLGRGLRLPRHVPVGAIIANFPVVTVTNHERFATHITALLDEVTDCELRFTSGPIVNSELKRHAHHFGLFNLEYLPQTRPVDRTPEDLDDKDLPAELALTPFAETLGVKVIYLEGSRRFELSKEFVTVDQVVLDIERRFDNIAFEGRRFDFGDGPARDLPGREAIEAIIRKAMASAGMAGERLSNENRKQIDLFFNRYLPKGTKKVVREASEGNLIGVHSLDMHPKSARCGGLDQEVSVLISEDYRLELGRDNRFVLDELAKGPVQQELGFDGSALNEPFNPTVIRRFAKGKNLFVANPSLFKTPQDLVILSHEPERLFAFRLIEAGRLVSGWIKAPDRDFYPIDYEYWKGGKDRVRRSFNPDFFIRIHLDHYLERLGARIPSPGLDRWRRFQDNGIRDIILVVEIKDDDDDSEATRAKGLFAADHFQRLNRLLAQTNPIDVDVRNQAFVTQRYAFFILRPADYAGWFARLQNGLLAGDGALASILP
jgi:type III restriction enzyme